MYIHTYIHIYGEREREEKKRKKERERVTRLQTAEGDRNEDCHIHRIPEWNHEGRARSSGCVDADRVLRLWN